MPFMVEVHHKHASPPFPPSSHASHESTVEEDGNGDDSDTLLNGTVNGSLDDTLGVFTQEEIHTLTTPLATSTDQELCESDTETFLHGIDILRSGSTTCSEKEGYENAVSTSFSVVKHNRQEPMEEEEEE
eukprot:5564382-Ditylum_brightwellii.AAC.1